MLVPLQIGDLDVMVEARHVLEQGTEPTSVGDRVRVTFNQATSVVTAVAMSTVDIARELASQSRAPDAIEVELGLSFSTTGAIIVAGTTAGATLKVKIVFQRSKREVE